MPRIYEAKKKVEEQFQNMMDTHKHMGQILEGHTGTCSQEVSARRSPQAEVLNELLKLMGNRTKSYIYWGVRSPCTWAIFLLLLQVH